MEAKPKNPYREHWKSIRRHLNWKEPGLEHVFLIERMVMILINFALIATPSMLVRYLAGLKSRACRKIAVEIYVILKAGFAIVALFLGLPMWKWFDWIAVIALVDLFAFLFGVILFRGQWRAPISENRSLIMIGVNFFEYTAWFAGLYLKSQSLVFLGETVADPGAAFYFSIVTAATVGYGDITPLGFGRFLAGTQIALSVGYLAAVVAYFVGRLDQTIPTAEIKDAPDSEKA